MNAGINFYPIPTLICIVRFNNIISDSVYTTEQRMLQNKSQKNEH